MSTAKKTTAAPTQHHWLRIALAVVALVELADALSSIHNIFTDYHHPTALLHFAQALTSVKLALATLVAGAAAVLAVIGRTRLAIGAEAFFHHFVFPAAAIAGAALALKARRLALAGLLVSLPTLINWTGVIAFTIGIMIYGF
jgi:hypothetical protein